MTSIIFASVPIHGHVTPLLPLAAELVARGDRVRFLTGSRFAAVVAATGAEHVVFEHELVFGAARFQRALEPLILRIAHRRLPGVGDLVDAGHAVVDWHG